MNEADNAELMKSKVIKTTRENFSPEEMFFVVMFILKSLTLLCLKVSENAHMIKSDKSRMLDVRMGLTRDLSVMAELKLWSHIWPALYKTLMANMLDGAGQDKMALFIWDQYFDLVNFWHQSSSDIWRWHGLENVNLIESNKD